MNEFIDFCRTVGKLLQTKPMADNKSFMICDVKEEQLEVVQSHIDANNLQVRASYDANDGKRPAVDKNGNPYPPSIWVNYNHIDISGWE